MFSKLKNTLRSAVPLGNDRMAALAGHETFSSFDAKFYRFTHPDLADLKNIELQKHFLEDGWKQGADPSAEFSTNVYLALNSDVAASKQNPFVHYLTKGRTEGRGTHLSNWMRAGSHNTPVSMLDATMGQFEFPYLRKQLPSEFAPLSDRALASYFLQIGWRDGLNPSSEFSTQYYLQTNADVHVAGTCPLVHYVTHGQFERRLRSATDQRIVRSGLDKKSADREMELIADIFDPDYYRKSYADMTGDDKQVLLHYVLFGWREGRNPCAQFSTTYYLNSNEDVVKEGNNPLVHYVSHGRAEGRRALPEPKALQPEENESNQAVAPYFDANFYSEVNTDLDLTDDSELLHHFMTTGWREGRDPNAEFSVSYYLESYPDIQLSGSNPFLHFVLFGKKEGRRGRKNAATPLRFNPNAQISPEHLVSVLPSKLIGKKKPKPPATSRAGSLKLHWVIPDFSRGSGGHMTIFRMISFLELFGHECKIWIETPTHHQTSNDAWEDIIKYFQCVRAEVAFVSDGFYEAKGDAVIATGWSTAYTVAQATGFVEKFYFVQDHEPEFYPTGTESLLARKSYDFDMSCICASPWLDQIMTEKYGRWARHFYLAYDHQVYNVAEKRAYLAATPDRKLKIAVYARDHTARRCVYLALMALETMGHQRKDFEVHLFGQDRLDFQEVNFAAVNHGILDTEGLAKLYGDCDLGITFSGTNYSLVPQEMMACGLPLVELDVESTRAIFPDGVVTFAGPAPIDIATKISELLDKPKNRAKQAKAALDWVSGFSWEGSAKAVEAALLERLAEKTKLTAPPKKKAKRPLLDVVIPTWNGMGELEPVIEALRNQVNPEDFQIYCIDSSSNDGTTEWLAKQKDIKLTVIPQSEFQHGRTRNFGASLGSSKYIAFLTQDAMPATKNWAADIIRMLDHNPKAAGIFGRHLPYPDHPEFVRDEITTHFEGMQDLPIALSKDTDPDKWASGDLGWRQLLHFYSDNNSAMRREIWNEIPYAEVDYGEDQIWARDIVEAGYTKLYAPSATVFHSHDYNPAETYKRAKTEAHFFYKYFGYTLGTGTEVEIADRVATEQSYFRAWASKRDVDEAEFEMRQQNIAEKYRGWRDGLAVGLKEAKK